MSRQAILFARHAFSVQDLDGRTDAELLNYHLSDTDNTEVYDLEDLQYDLNHNVIDLTRSLIYFI